MERRRRATVRAGDRRCPIWTHKDKMMLGTRGRCQLLFLVGGIGARHSALAPRPRMAFILFTHLWTPLPVSFWAIP
jgi:hypothetical protein